MNEFWLGAALSVPIGICTNLASPAIGRLLERRNQRAAQKQQAERAERAELAAEMARDQSAFYSHLLTALLRTTYIGALFGILAGVAAALGQAVFINGLFVVSSICALIGAILVLNISRGALVMIQEVRDIRRGPTSPPERPI